MLFLILSILASVTIGNLLHFYQSKDSKLKILQVFLGNYFVAALVSFFMIEDFDFNFNLLDLGLGILFGSLFLLNFLNYQTNIIKNGLSMSISVMRVSVVIPILVSLIFFKDVMQWQNLVGVLVVVLAFSLMGKSSGVKSKLWLFMLFFITGFTEIGLKLFHEIATASPNQMLFILFTAAFFINLALIIYRKEKIQFKFIAAGLVLGVPNQLSSYFFLLGLITIPATIAYPLVSSNVVLLGFLTDKVIWKSKFSRNQYIIIGLILLGVILLNIR